ncbi:MAG: outer membrane protein assembly factor BamE [Betaproteobacteria bacterium]|nr:outer membrane protein assembly factor BamE [Betaproteobacteria bacterium]
MRLVAVIALTLALAGCGRLIHRIDIQQGNVVAPETFLKLKTGMTKTEVRNLLGTPLLTDIFHGNRWDYYFSFESRGKLVEQNKFAVYFENEKMVRVEGGPTPSAARVVPSASPTAPPDATPSASPAAEPSAAPSK